MTLLVTANEGEATPLALTLTTSQATVNRRGSYLATRFWRRPFRLRADSPKLYMSASYTKRNTTSPYYLVYNNTTSGLLTIVDKNFKNLARIRAMKTGTTSWQIVLDCYNSSGVWTDALVTMEANTLMLPSRRYDLMAEYNIGTDTMTVSAYNEGVVAATVTYPISTAGVNAPRGGEWGTVHSPEDLDYMWFYVNDMFVDDESTVGRVLTTLQGSSAGFHTGASGTYVGISETGTDLTNGITFDTVGNKFSWNVTPLAGKDYSGSSIGAIALSLLAARSSSSLVTGLRPFVRLSGVDYYIGDAVALGEDMQSYTFTSPNNPATGLPWTPTQITAGVEVGLEAVAI